MIAQQKSVVFVTIEGYTVLADRIVRLETPIEGLNYHLVTYIDDGVKGTAYVESYVYNRLREEERRKLVAVNAEADALE